MYVLCLELSFPKLIPERASSCAITLAKQGESNSTYICIAEGLYRTKIGYAPIKKPATLSYRRINVALAFDKLGYHIKALVEKIIVVYFQRIKFINLLKIEL